MGIVAAQCRVFIAQNDICAPRPLYYHLFFLDNRRVPARSLTRRLPDSLLLPSIPTAFHTPYLIVSSFGSLFEPPGGSFRRSSRHLLASPHRLSDVSCAVPVGSPLVLSSVFHLFSPSPQSESSCEGRSVSSNAERSMLSLRSPFRSPVRRAVRVVFRGVGRGGRRGVLWDVSRGTGRFPVHFLMHSRCRPCHLTGMPGIPVRWMKAVPCCHHAMQGVSYMSCCGVSRSLSICQSVVGRHITAYMVVPLLFSFLGGSGSGTASWRVLCYSVVL